MRGLWIAAAIGGLLMTAWTSASGSEREVKGYITDIPKETPAQREARHARVAGRLKGPVVMVHRGASAFAPENTLEAYAAAMDYGADGCEIDPRRTADGVIVLFHDDMLENRTDGFGSVSQLTYYELLNLKFRHIYGSATRETRIPTLTALLELARQRAMLLHFDFKEPGMDREVAKMLDEADMWDQVVALNWDNAGSLLGHPKIKLLKDKTVGLYEDRSDADIEATTAALAKPGDMIIVDDPRVPAKVLKRPAYQPVPLPTNLRRDWTPSHPAPLGDEQAPRDYIESATKSLDITSIQQITRLLDTSRIGRTDTDGSADYQRKRAQGILLRAWAARRLGEMGKKDDQTVKLLEFQVEHRSLHRDWRYQGLDGASAVGALAKLGAIESVPMLAKSLMSADPDLAKARSLEYPDTPAAVIDWRIKGAIVSALGELRCEASKEALESYLAMDEARAKELGIPMFAEAAKSLLKQDLSTEELKALLKHARREVRGTAVLACLDHPSRERTAALKEAAPWALELPSAQKGTGHGN